MSQWDETRSSESSCPLRLTINGEQRELDGVSTVQDAILALGLEGELFAVALNREFVPRRKYGETGLKANDALEILSPMQGG